MPVKEHPVPQNITSYRFRLVGSMTLQQFSELAGGFGLGFILWKLPIYPIIKMPLAVAAAVLGIMMAFVPIEDRPLDMWLTAFVKHIYRPTLYLFKTRPTPPPFSLYQPPKNSGQKNDLDGVKAIDPNQYLSSFTTNKTSPVTDYVNRLFDEEKVKPVKSRAKQVQPLAKPIVKKLPISPITPSTPTNQIKAIKSRPIMPKTKTIKTAAGPGRFKAKRVKKPVVAQKPTFEPSLPKTKLKNTPVGMVADLAGKPIVGAIVEVKNVKSDIPLRVTKTNILGQFFFGNPLPTGEYLIEAEHAAYAFKPVKISVKNKVILPIKITGQKQVENV